MISPKPLTSKKQNGLITYILHQLKTPTNPISITFKTYIFPIRKAIYQNLPPDDYSFKWKTKFVL